MKNGAKTRSVAAAPSRFEMWSPDAATTNPSRIRAWRAELDALQEETPLVPEAVAYRVCEEASVFLDAELPASWAALLVEKTAVISMHNPRFRRMLCSRGNRGRDGLWAFMRHWLAALIAKQLPALFARLPADYSRGQPLPAPQCGPPRATQRRRRR